MSIKDTYEDLILDWSPERFRVTQEYLKDLRGGFVPDWWADCVAQHTWRRHQIVDAGTMQMMELWLRIGYLAVGRVHIGESPSADKEREKNQERLNEACPELDARVSGGHDNDGSVAVSENLRFVKFMKAPPFGFSKKPPSRVPLEIGTTGSHNTFLHLQRMRGLARWPYRHEYLWIFWFRGPHLVEVFGEEDKELTPRVQLALEDPLPKAPSRLLTMYWEREDQEQTP